MSNADELKEMAKLTILSGRVSELQEKNMKMYPFVFFNGVQGVTIDFDLSTTTNVDESDKKKLTIKNPTRNHYVEYRLAIYEKADNPHMDRRYFALENAIRALFWKNVIVRIYVNNNKMFESK